MKKSIKFLSFFLSIVFIVGALGLPAIAAGPPSVSAKSAILTEAESGRVLYQKSAHIRLPMASTTKIMTAIVAIEEYPDLGKEVKIDKRAVGVEGSSVYLYENEVMTMEDLLYALLLSSANDAAVAIACEVGGSIDAFAEKMNRKAEALGLEDTHFTNPNGLHDDNHYTTAYDLAAITAYALKNPTFKKIVSTKKKTVPMQNGESVRLLINHNKLLSLYDGAIGVKTGFTKKSGRCLVSAAERDGLTLVAVTLDAPNDWKDHSDMLDFGFDSYERKNFGNAGDISFDVPVISGEENSVKVRNSQPLSVFISKEHPEIKCTVELPRFVFADVKEGEVIGRIVYTCNGNIVAESPLKAEKRVNSIKYKKNFFEWITSLFV